MTEDGDEHFASDLEIFEDPDNVLVDDVRVGEEVHHWIMISLDVIYVMICYFRLLALQVGVYGASYSN